MTPYIMDTIDFRPDTDRIHLTLMKAGEDGFRPEPDGPTVAITLPLSQFGPMLGEFQKAYAGSTKPLNDTD